jgi:hypothetical protein
MGYWCASVPRLDCGSLNARHGLPIEQLKAVLAINPTRRDEGALRYCRRCVA